MINMEHITAGDQIVIVARDFDAIATVRQITNTQIILTNGSKYWRTNGKPVSCREDDAHSIREATSEDHARITYSEATKLAESALCTSSLNGYERNQIQNYRTRLLAAKAIIDAALDAGEATA